MRTVKEVADLLDVSQVSIYNHLKKNDKELKGLVIKKKGVTHIKDEGVKVLKISLGIISVPEVKETISLANIIDEISLNITTDIKKDYDDLQVQIQELQNQNKEIKEQNDKLIDLIEYKQNQTLWDKMKGLFKK